MNKDFGLKNTAKEASLFIIFLAASLEGLAGTSGSGRPGVSSSRSPKAISGPSRPLAAGPSHPLRGLRARP